MAKTLQQLLMSELGSDDPDKVDAVADVVFDWLERTERNGNVYLAEGWRSVTETNRTTESNTGQGR